MIVTLQDPKTLNACSLNIEKFRDTFGEQVEVTVDNILRAFAARIDVDWWARKVFPDYRRGSGDGLGSQHETVRVVRR